MMLVSDKIYHVYNRANGHENLFKVDENYGFFLLKVALYISPIADMYCYCLLPNHFHFCLRIKTIEETILHFEKLTKEHYTSLEEKADILVILTQLYSYANLNDKEILFQSFLSRQFAKLFSSYTQSFNKKYKRKGSLFMKNFKRKEIDNTNYLTNIVKYIHKNPIHHGIVNNYSEWKWSSYNAYTNDQLSNVKKDDIINLYGSKEAFVKFHTTEIDKNLHDDLEYSL